MRIGVAQINPTLGDFQANKDKILEYSRLAKERRCNLVVFPEATLFGYHPFDLLERPEVIDQQDRAFKEIQKKIPSGLAVIFGLITKNPAKKGRPLFNSAVLLEKGRRPRYFHKQLLPTGGVFDEARFIAQGEMKDNFFSYGGKKFFLTICEDIWAWADKKGHSQYDFNPIEKLQKTKVDFVINLSASPFFPGKYKVRQDLVRRTAARLKAPMLYCNLVGAQDEIIFDGSSFVLDEKGRERMRCMAFEEDFNYFDLKEGEGPIHPRIEQPVEELRQALVLGIRDFCHKTGFQRVHLGLSGGVDSALVATLAVDALGASNVKGLYLPTEFSSELSQKIAEQLAKNLNIDLKTVSIQKDFEGIRSTVDQSFAIQNFGLVHENLQARLRSLLLMSYANQFGSLLLGTSNKSELAAGYATLYGDMGGGLLPIGDLTKQQVYALCEHYNRQAEVIPKAVIERAPSAELKPNQKDQDTLPPYSELDPAVVNVVQHNKTAKTPTEKWLLNAVVKSEFKRWQAPPILKVSSHSFGRGRRWPVAHRALI